MRKLRARYPAKNMIQSFPDQKLRAICDVLGETSEGLSGGEIRRLLADCCIDDPYPGLTKRHRLFEALSTRQKVDGCANNVARFICAAMDPVRYAEKRALFEERRARVNAVLAFTGLSIDERGELRSVATARTISEAQERAGRLRSKLLDRGVHADVLRFCREELLDGDYFHAVSEATKSVADKIRTKSDLTLDGARLVDAAFGFSDGSHPRVAFNSLRTETEQSEQRGLMNLLKGLFGAFRNPTAHEARIHWRVDEQDALDVLTLASMLHRRLDAAVRTRVS